MNDNGDLLPSDWTPEDGWATKSTLNIYPRPAAGLQNYPTNFKEYYYIITLTIIVYRFWKSYGFVCGPECFY